MLFRSIVDSTQPGHEDSVTEQLSSTLDDLRLDEVPQKLLVPDSLLKGAHGVMGGHLITLEKETYSNLTTSDVSQPTLQLSGGISRNSEEQSPESKHAKVCTEVSYTSFVSCRILVSTSANSLDICKRSVDRNNRSQLPAAVRDAYTHSRFP